MPQQYLIICSSPRTGSTWLSSLLSEAGLISGGEEFFEPGLVMPRSVFPQLGITIDDVLRDFDGYVERIKTRWEAPGRHFCVKLHWRDFRKWPRKLFLERHFPAARYLLCTRADPVLQAISNYRARATGGWVKGAAQRPDPPYDFLAIQREIEELTSYNEAWEGYFREKNIQPFRTTYEELERNYRKVVRRIAAWMGSPLGFWASRKLRSPIQKQRDKTADEWRARFLKERAAASSV